MILKEFMDFLKLLLAAATAAAVISFVVAMSFWWGTYFSIKMVLDLIVQAFGS